MADVSSDAYERFCASMVIDNDKWRDGIGYDLSLLAIMTEADRLRLAEQLASRTPLDWRDIEALAAIERLPQSLSFSVASSCSSVLPSQLECTAAERARASLRHVVHSGDANSILAVARFAPHVVSTERKANALVHALQTAKFYEGLSQAIDEAAELHPPQVVQALFEAALTREGEVAVHFAALLFYIYGQAAEPFDWAHRPFFLTFATEVAAEREAAFRELCQRVKVDPSLFGIRAGA